MVQVQNDASIDGVSFDFEPDWRAPCEQLAALLTGAAGAAATASSAASGAQHGGGGCRLLQNL